MDTAKQLLQKKIKACTMRLLRNKWKQQDQTYQERINQKSREYYQKTKKIQITSSSKWNKENKEKRNHTRRKLYSKKRCLQIESLG